MIVNDEYKYIFIHVPKTAGTAVRSFLKEGVFSVNGYGNLHTTALEAKTLISEEKFNTYYKFSIVRNPYDRFLSKFFYFSKNKNRIDFDKLSSAEIKLYFEKIYLAKILGTENPYLQENRQLADNIKFVGVEFVGQSRSVCDNEGNIIVNNICKYENLTDDLDKVFNKLQLPFSAKDMPLVNASFDPGFDKQELLTDYVKEALYTRYESDFKTFGYSPEYP